MLEMFDHNMVNGAEFEFLAVVCKGRIRIVRTLVICKVDRQRLNSQ